MLLIITRMGWSLIFLNRDVLPLDIFEYWNLVLKEPLWGDCCCSQWRSSFRLCADWVWLTTLTLKIFSCMNLCAYLAWTPMFSWSVDSIPLHNLSLIHRVQFSFRRLCLEVRPLPTPTIVMPYYFFLLSLGLHICLEREWLAVIKVSSSSSCIVVRIK